MSRYFHVWIWSIMEITESMLVKLQAGAEGCSQSIKVETPVNLFTQHITKTNIVFFQQIVMFYPSRSSWISREAISLRASLGRQKLLISSSLRARAPLSTRAKLPWSKKGSRGPRESKAGPPICPSAWEEPCRAAGRCRASGIKGNSHLIWLIRNDLIKQIWIPYLSRLSIISVFWISDWNAARY